MHDFSKPVGSDRNPLVESGVIIISRDASQLNLMKGTMRALPRDVRDQIRRIIHDSDCRFHVEVYEHDHAIAENVACQIAQRFVRFCGGYNDIYVKWGGIILAHRTSEWDSVRLAELREAAQ
jgi:hypothetical protein